VASLPVESPSLHESDVTSDEEYAEPSPEIYNEANLSDNKVASADIFPKKFGSLKNDDNNELQNKNIEDGIAKVTMENELNVIQESKENIPTPPLHINVGISLKDQEFISIFVNGNAKHENFTKLSIEISNYEKVSKNHLQIKKSIKDFCCRYSCQTHKNSKFFAFFGIIKNDTRVGLISHCAEHSIEELLEHIKFL
jgi:hypothetical protein